MKPNDTPSTETRPLPGQDAQSGETVCPKCGRFVGAAATCPYCGSKAGKRMSLVALRWAAVLLSTVGLVLLYFMARTREPETVRIGDIETTMNFGLVRLSGEVQYDARPFKNGNGMSFGVSDGSGSIVVFVDPAQRKAMADGDLVPRRGDGIDFVVQLQASSSGHSARIRSLKPDFFQLTRRADRPDRADRQDRPDRADRRDRGPDKDFGPAVPFSAIGESLVGTSVVLEGTVVAVKEPEADSKRPYVITLTNATDGVDLKVWPDQFGRIADPASLTGTPVRAKVAVKRWKDRIDLQLKRGDDLRRADAPVPARGRRAPVPVSEAAAAAPGGWVTVEGALSEPADLSGKGTSYRLTDASGSIQVVFWNGTVPPGLQKKAAAAARVRVNGKLKEYKGTRQVVPSKETGVEIAGEEAP